MIDDIQLNNLHQKVPRDYYDQGLRNNIWQRYWHQKRFKAIQEIIDSSNIQGPVLDIGCHSGTLTKKIADFTKARVFALDISKPAIKYAQKKYPEIIFQVNDIQKKTPFSDSYFELVTCFDVLEHLNNLKEAIGEIHRILKNKGYFIVGIPNENLLFRITWAIWLKFRGKVWQDTHLHHFRPKLLESIIEKRGFQKVQEKSIHFNMYCLLKYKLTK